MKVVFFWYEAEKSKKGSLGKAMRRALVLFLD
jgi:hypothetical protein